MNHLDTTNSLQRVLSTKFCTICRIHFFSQRQLSYTCARPHIESSYCKYMLSIRIADWVIFKLFLSTAYFETMFGNTGMILITGWNTKSMIFDFNSLMHSHYVTIATKSMVTIRNSRKTLCFCHPVLWLEN